MLSRAMGIVVVYDEPHRQAAEIVATALGRSFTRAQVSRVLYADALSAPGDLPSAAALIAPPRAASPLVARMLTSGRKLLALGPIENDVAELLGLAIDSPQTSEGEGSGVGGPRAAL